MDATEAKLAVSTKTSNDLLAYIQSKISDAVDAGLLKVTVTIPNIDKTIGQAVLSSLRQDGFIMRIHTVEYPEDDEINMTINWSK